MPAYRFRAATVADLDALVEMHLELQDHLERANPALWRMKDQARAQVKGQLHSRLTGSNNRTLVAEHEEDGIVGVVFGRVVINEHYLPSRTGMVDQLFVRAAHRRARVGSGLVAGLCAYFAGAGVEDLSLRYVAGNDEAKGFWAALGFTPRIVTVGASRLMVELQLAQAAEI